MAYDALALLAALDLRGIDILGYSMGGFVAQELTLIRPRLELAGTGPQDGPELHGYRDEVYGNATADELGADDLLALFFERSQTSIEKGQEFIQRIFARTEGRDDATSLDTRDRQLDAVTTWGIPDASRLDRLAGITQPVLAANGDNDRMVPTVKHAPARRAAAQREAEDLPGRRSRLPLPVPGRVRSRARRLPLLVLAPRKRRRSTPTLIHQGASHVDNDTPN